MKRCMIMASLVLCSGCVEPGPDQLVVNHRDTDVTLIFRAKSYRPASYGMGCQAPVTPALIPIEDVPGYHVNELKLARVTQDPETCEERITLPARTAALITSGEACNDTWQEWQSQPHTQPEFTFLRIESSSGTIEWRGWEVSRALVAHRGYFSRDTCRLDIT